MKKTSFNSIIFLCFTLLISTTFAQKTLTKGVTDKPKTEHERYLELQQQRKESSNLSKNKVADFELIKNASKPEIVILDLSVRQQNIFKSSVVNNYFSQNQLSQFEQSKLDDIAYYFNKSFRIEVLEEANDQYKINEFVANLDPYFYENKRKEAEEVKLEIPESGVRLILEARNSLSYGIQNYLTKQKRGKCLTCDKSVRIPRESPEAVSMKKVNY